MKTDEMRQKWMGTLGLLCEASVYVPEDIRESFEMALDDFVAENSDYAWTRTFDRLDIEYKQEES